MTFAETVSEIKESILTFAETASLVFGTALSPVKTDPLRFVGDTEKSADGFLTYFGRFPDNCRFCVESFPLGVGEKNLFIPRWNNPFVIRCLHTNEHDRTFTTF